jgi:hypothetical protein
MRRCRRLLVVGSALRGVTTDPAGRASAHRDLHRELRRGGRDRPSRRRAFPAARLQRPQRLQRVGPAGPIGRMRYWSASTARRTRRPSSRPVTHSGASTTGSGSTTTSKHCPFSSADRRGPGIRSGRASPTTTEKQAARAREPQRWAGVRRLAELELVGLHLCHQQLIRIGELARDRTQRLSCHFVRVGARDRRVRRRD